MHDLRHELRALPSTVQAETAWSQALHLEARRIFSIRRELLAAFYLALATLLAGVGLLIKANLERIGPAALLAGILVAAALCYAVALRARLQKRERSLGEDYVLLLGALLFSAAVGYAEVQFRLFGAAWPRHLLLLAAWHLASAYGFRSRLALSVALMAFAGWLGVEARLGTVFEPRVPMFGASLRSLLCTLLFWFGSLLHRHEDPATGAGFRPVYQQFAANFGFWGALGLGGESSTRWLGAMVLLLLAVTVGRTGLNERRESFLLYAVGYTTLGLVWLELLLLGPLAASWLGLATITGAVVLLSRLRSRLKESVE
ncbi:MAG: DUF2157 domain-containing protein [Sinobacteraceae bacterium]|nr:DUF2157 domain-containing protein [Nevskiaceae bacterium]